jgi:hypothetical protein
MNILVRVTKEILERSMFCGTLKGSPNVGENCAVALAVRDIFPKASVGNRMISWHGGTEVSTEEAIYMPEEARLFIKGFDLMKNFPQHRLLLEPISFMITVPPAVIDKIGVSQVYKILSESKTLHCVSI